MIAVFEASCSIAIACLPQTPLLPNPQSGSSLQSLWNSLFWIAVALAAVLALHVGIRALVIWRAWPMPLFFEVRRVLAA